MVEKGREEGKGGVGRGTTTHQLPLHREVVAAKMRLSTHHGLVGDDGCIDALISVGVLLILHWDNIIDPLHLLHINRLSRPAYVCM